MRSQQVSAEQSAIEVDDPVASSAITVVNDALESVAKYVGVMLFSVMIAVVFYEVVMRYVFNAPTFWSEAMARAAMVWLVMLGLARGVRHLDNIRVDFLVERMPPSLQSLCAWARFAFVALFALVMLFFGGQLALENWSQTNTGFEISVMWIYLSVPVSGFYILMFSLELILKGERRPF